VVQLLEVGVLQRVLVERLGELPADADGGQDLRVASAWGRSARGLSRMKMRPVLGTTFEPLAPMNDMNSATCGLRRTTAATACWRSVMASKDTSCAASVNAKIDPLSSVGMKPLGITAKR
jgi:hypothetical protein